MKKKVGIIGSGFSGLSAAGMLAANGFDVMVYEKNRTIGGRARQKHINGFLFDMGPSWYWMPDVFEKFFNKFGHSTSDFYELKKLDPGFTVVFKDNERLEIPSDIEELKLLFENMEKGSAKKLEKFLLEAEYKYNAGMNNLVYKPAYSVHEFINLDTLKGIFRLDVFSSFKNHVRKYFKDPRLTALMEFPVLFLGAMPADTPALYSLMNYAGLKLGTWYPMGGFGKVISAFEFIAKKYGAEIFTNEPVRSISVKENEAFFIRANGHSSSIDAVIGAADYHHIEKDLIPESRKNYDESYWETKTFAPSCLIFYLGINRKIKGLNHHTLFFDEDFQKHAAEIYKDKKWPDAPLFYVCCTSKTDPITAPEGCENLFILMPVAAGLRESDEIKQKYFDQLINRIEKFTGENIRDSIIVNESYCVTDFKKDYNAYKGNAYGLANTLMQSAFLKPSMRNRKIKNLFYSGQLTVPGPGVPPAIISGQIAAGEIIKKFGNQH